MTTKRAPQTHTDPERAMPDARRTLENNLAALIDPRPATHDGKLIWQNSLYLELTEAIRIGGSGGTRHAPGSKPPCWLAGVDLEKEISRTARKWVRNGAGPEKPTVNRLRYLTCHHWRPQDVDQINSIAAQIAAWTKDYNALIGPKSKTLPNPCPRCEEKWSYRRVDGEHVRRPALEVTPDQCHCTNCGATWQAREFQFLARVLGYQKPDGVLT